MSEVMIVMAIIGGYLLLQIVVLPRLGVGT
jgi:hypothetical protein